MNQSSGGVESRHAGTQPLRCPIGRTGSEKLAAAGVAPGPLDQFIRYRRIAILALIVLLGLARWLGDGGNPSW